eukprot:CAMPEP_0202694654 /NCGR_PEP_ID=MMETSP1385-20130828/8459_1 /ASSEMBLY_ACC=CAM_ASM_000861 /TAXON_ID=933848 /ORGANISM="Elphidium margaritaceum" /LENGTH=362 /DNA_ID=CAMNT_0049350541 /DNA_START=35 /DNA_END=1123 /DNA_ORIENTATION=-
MQHDTIIWNVISPSQGGFCSFRRRIPGAPTRFCKNAYNVLGICAEMACPLANSRYATVRETRGTCYLMMKTIERAHTPSKHWEKIKLSSDYMTALKQIDEHLLWWPKWYIHKCKLRLTKMHQYLIRSRKLALSIQPKLVRIWKPYERQQRNRERKAEIAAKISNVVKAELLERLHEGVYEGIYNFPQRVFKEVLDEKGEESEHEEVDVSDAEQEHEREARDKQKAKAKTKASTEDEFVGVIESDLEVEEDEQYESEQDIEEAPEYEYEYEYENEFGTELPMTQQQTMSQSKSKSRQAHHRSRNNNSNKNGNWNSNTNRNGNQNNGNDNNKFNKKMSGKRGRRMNQDTGRQSKKRKIAIGYDR